MNKNRSLFATVALTVLTTLNTQFGIAQNNELRLAGAEVIDKSAYTNLPNFIKFGRGREIKPENIIDWAVYAFNVPGNATFKPYETFTDELGYAHTRYKQYVNNYPVEGTQIISHAKDGVVKMVNGDFYQNFSSNLSASLSETAALQFALQKVNAKKYMWEDDFMVKMGDQNYFPKGELVVVHKRGADYAAENTRLAYKFNIYAAEPLSRANIFVDANTGEILDKEILIHTADVVGTAVTKFSGTVTMTCDNTSGPYRLRETGRGLGVETYNLNHSSSYTNTDFTNSSSTWNVTGANQAASDAHWGAEMTYDYYKNIHGRNSINGSGYKLLSYVHYSNNYVNAFWDGTRMTYGDGDVTQGFLIMTALDVCGHEITHGLTSFTSGLNGGGSGEPDALNEGNSDIFGTTIEAYARPTQWDWIMGADITCNSSGVQDHIGIRDMSNPKNPNYPQPNCYHGTYWDAAGEPHNNDGPFIYWYYLLCQGGSGTNDIGSAWSVTGITMAKAKMIAFRQSTVYFTSSTTYANARSYSIQAATDLYGSCSPELKATTNAWYAIGVGAQYSGTVLTVTETAAASTICNGSNTTITAGGATTYSWTPSTGLSATTGSTVTATPTITTTYTVTGTSSTCTGKNSTIITVTPPPSVNVTASSFTICNGGNTTLTASGTSSYTWSSNAGSATTSTVSVSPSTNTTYTVTGSNGGCTATKTVSVNVTSSPSVTASASASSICSGSSTILTGGGATNYTWSANAGSATTNTVSVSPTTNTTYTVTGSNGGCTATNTVAVTISSALNVTASASASSICNGSSTILTGGGATNYTWSANAGSATTNSVSVSPTTNTTYTVTGSNGSCTGTKTVSVVVTNAPNVTASASASSICSGSGTMLTASGATNYTWSTNAGSATTNTVSVSPTTNTTYTVTGSNGSCTGTKTVSVVVTSSPNVIASASSSTICSGLSTTLTGNGATSYTWSANAGSATTSTVSVSPASTTVYTVTGANGGCSGVSTLTVTVNPSPTLTVNDITICDGTSGILTASGATSYTWTTGATTNTISVSPTVTTVYNVTGVSGGCGAGRNVTVTVNPSPTLTVNNATICAGATATLTASGATSYTWTTGALTNTIAVSPTVTTVYNVTGASGGCGAGRNVTVIVNTLPSTPTISQSGGVLTSSSATGNQWYLNGNIIPGATAQTYTPTQNGNYTVIVTQGGCDSNTSAAYNYNTTGINTNANVDLVNIFPNPNDGNFTLIFSNQQTENYVVEIVNAIGQVIYREDLMNHSGNYKKEFSKNDYSEGIYLVSLSNGSSRVIKKIIVH
jgi:Zn-dependent metalloprotease